jgi:hypothetical protein
MKLSPASEVQKMDKFNLSDALRRSLAVLGADAKQAAVTAWIIQNYPGVELQLNRVTLASSLSAQKKKLKEGGMPPVSGTSPVSPMPAVVQRVVTPAAVQEPSGAAIKIVAESLDGEQASKILERVMAIRNLAETVGGIDQLVAALGIVASIQESLSFKPAAKK